MVAAWRQFIAPGLLATAVLSFHAWPLPGRAHAFGVVGHLSKSHLQEPPPLFGHPHTLGLRLWSMVLRAAIALPQALDPSTKEWLEPKVVLAPSQ